MGETAAIFATFAAISAAAFCGPALRRLLSPAPSTLGKGTLLSELAAAETRVRSLAGPVSVFISRVASAEVAGREPSDRDALHFSLTQLEALDAAHWGVGDGAGLPSSAAAGAALARLRRDAEVAAAAVAVLAAHPLFAPPNRVFEALVLLNKEELALTKKAIGVAAAEGVPVLSAEFERVQRAVLRERLKEVGPTSGDAGSGALLAALCPDLKKVAPVWTSAVQLGLAAERAGFAGYDGFEGKLGAITKRFQSAWCAPRRYAPRPPAPQRPLTPPSHTHTNPAHGGGRRVQKAHGGRGGERGVVEKSN